MVTISNLRQRAGWLLAKGILSWYYHDEDLEVTCQDGTTFTYTGRQAEELLSLIRTGESNAEERIRY